MKQNKLNTTVITYTKNIQNKTLDFINNNIKIVTLNPILIYLKRNNN